MTVIETLKGKAALHNMCNNLPCALKPGKCPENYKNYKTG
uniref:Uncharacterized protein n=1 Tax=Rhizophora mucronata TaxID=61149 RepID=A0A2P2N080_RHIMU